jgi:hypothetical protein
MISDDNNELENLYQNYWAFHASMIEKEHNPIEIAAILVAQAMSIYKTVLSPEDYNNIVDSISNSRDKVQQLEVGLGVLH